MGKSNRNKVSVLKSSQPENKTKVAEVKSGGPEHVVILGLGPSINQYTEITKRMGGKCRYADEVWGINALGDVYKCDKVFHMDDVRIQEIRANANPDSNIAAMLQWMKTCDVPIITSRLHPEYPSLKEFPLEKALNLFGFDYYNNTAAYAIVYAIMTGVKKISLFGIDFTYPNAHDAEKGRACCEFWLGIAAARGILISLPKPTTLMDAYLDSAGRLYGYDTQVIEFEQQENGSTKLKFTERETLPTAADIEKAYDHKAHPNPIVEKEREVEKIKDAEGQK